MTRAGSGPTRFATLLTCAGALLACSPSAPAGGPRPERTSSTEGARARAGDASAAAAPARPRIADPLLLAYDRTAPADVRVRSRAERDGFVELEVDYASPVVGRVPAYLRVPTGAGPFPALVLMHGLPGSPASLARLAGAYARVGVATLAVSAPYNRADLPYADQRLIKAPRFDPHDREQLIQTVKDLRRGIDVLAARPDIDGRAIGFVGHSYGATAGALLAAVEPRLEGFALMAPSRGLVTISLTGFRGLQAAVYAELEPGEREAWVRSMLDLEADRWIGLAPAGRGLIQAGRDDALVRPEDTIALSHAAPGLELRWYGAGHTLSREALREQAAFLGARLGFDAGRFEAPDSIY